MKIFVTGATGVIGRALIPRLASQGDEVFGMTKSAEKQELVRDRGLNKRDHDGLVPARTSQWTRSTTFGS